jgi:RNA polymerase sigma factor (sigma-70 family)
VKEEILAPAHEHPKMSEIFTALAPLKPQERAIIYMRTVEGYSYEELSKIMNKSQSALRKMYERAKNKAARLLEGFEYV